MQSWSFRLFWDQPRFVFASLLLQDCIGSQRQAGDAASALLPALHGTTAIRGCFNLELFA